MIAKTCTGKVFTWGWGGKGQLGQGDFYSTSKPFKVNFEETQEKVRIIQIAAGYRHSIVLFEDRKTYWWGTSGEMRNQSEPILFDFAKKV